jgi:hypothetical protein
LPVWNLVPLSQLGSPDHHSNRDVYSGYYYPHISSIPSRILKMLPEVDCGRDGPYRLLFKRWVLTSLKILFRGAHPQSVSTCTNRRRLREQGSSDVPLKEAGELSFGNINPRSAFEGTSSCVVAPRDMTPKKRRGGRERMRSFR